MFKSWLPSIVVWSNQTNSAESGSQIGWSSCVLKMWPGLVVKSCVVPLQLLVEHTEIGLGTSVPPSADTQNILPFWMHLGKRNRLLATETGSDARLGSSLQTPGVGPVVT